MKCTNRSTKSTRYQSIITRRSQHVGSRVKYRERSQRTRTASVVHNPYPEVNLTSVNVVDVQLEKQKERPIFKLKKLIKTKDKGRRRIRVSQSDINVGDSSAQIHQMDRFDYVEKKATSRVSTLSRSILKFKSASWVRI